MNLPFADEARRIGTQVVVVKTCQSPFRPHFPSTHSFAGQNNPAHHVPFPLFKLLSYK